MKEVEGIEVGAMISHISVIDGVRILLAGCGDNTDVRTMKMKKTILRGHSVMFVSSSDVRMQMWSQVRTLRRSVNGIARRDSASAFTQNILYDNKTKRMISSSRDDSIIVWDADTGEQIGMLQG